MSDTERRESAERSPERKDDKVEESKEERPPVSDDEDDRRDGDRRSRSPRARSRSASPRRSRSASPRRRQSRSPRRRSRSRSPRRRSRSPRRRHNSRRAKQHERENPPKGKVLGVFGLDRETTERTLEDVFSKYGELEKVVIIYDRQSGRSRGFAFVYFQEEAGAEEARYQMNGQDIEGRKVRVDYSVTKRAHTPTPGQYMGESRRRRRSPYGRRRSPYGRRSRSPYGRRRSRSPYGRRRSPYGRRSRSPRGRRSYSRSPERRGY